MTERRPEAGGAARHRQARPARRPTGVHLLLGEGRLDESGDFTKGAGLNAAAAERGAGLRRRAGAGGRGRHAGRWSTLIGGSAEGAEGLAELRRIDAALHGLGVGADRARFDPSVVRGLEYYTGAVFEAELLLETTDEKGEPMRFGSIGGGGRYDDLVARFTGEQVAGHRLLLRRLAPGRGAARGRPRAGRAARAARWWSSPSTRPAWPTTSPSPASCAPPASPAEVYLGSSGMKAADEVRRPPALARRDHRRRRRARRRHGDHQGPRPRPRAGRRASPTTPPGAPSGRAS